MMSSPEMKFLRSCLKLPENLKLQDEIVDKINVSIRGLTGQIEGTQIK